MQDAMDLLEEVASRSPDRGGSLRGPRGAGLLVTSRLS